MISVFLAKDNKMKVWLSFVIMSCGIAEISATRASTWSYCECEWLSWDSWSGCSSSCFGERKRNRKVQYKTHDGCDKWDDCDTDWKMYWKFEDCNKNCQNGGWLSGSSCSCPSAYDGTCCQYRVDCGTPGSVTNGYRSYSSTTYGSTARYHCNHGYRLVYGSQTRTCTSNRSWSGSKPSCIFANACVSNPCQNGATCINGLNTYTCNCAPGWSGDICQYDIQPPVVSGCPLDEFINATERTFVFNWTEPQFTDPFGNTVEVRKNYPTPYFEFPWGDFTVQYHGTKTSNGLSVDCIFNLHIRPTPCDELNVPMNGARVCNGWQTDYGRVCIVACMENYTLPPNQSFRQLYVCGASGKWLPRNMMPNCSVPVTSPEDALVYQEDHRNYTLASCSNTTSTMAMREQYIRVLNNSREFKMYCNKYGDGDCNADNVHITCG